MTYRKKYAQDVHVHENVYDMSSETLCPPNIDGFHKKKYTDRKCTDCGVEKLQLSSEELRTDDLSPDVSWECFEYVTVKSKRGETKKLMLVKKKLQNPVFCFSI